MKKKQEVNKIFIKRKDFQNLTREDIVYKVKKEKSREIIFEKLKMIENCEEKMKLVEERLKLLEEVCNLPELIGIEKELTIEEEIRKYPKRFERLTDSGWNSITDLGLNTSNNIVILNTKWNNYTLDDVVYYLEFDGCYKEIIRRKEE